MPILDWTQVKASAPGSFVLVGEYADLYDKNAIAVTIDRQTRVSIRLYKEGRLRLNLKNFNDLREWPTTSLAMTRLVGRYNDILDYSDTIPPKLNHLLNKRYKVQPKLDATLKCEPSSILGSDHSDQVEKSVIAFLMLYIALGDSYAWSARPSLDIEVESDIPLGRGYGSSSSYGVALCAALMKVYRISAEPAVINNWALNVDKFFHGKASGLHTSVIVHGGYIYFQNSKVKYSGIPHTTPMKALFIDTFIRRNDRALIKILENQQTESSNDLQATLENISDIVVTTWRKFNDPYFWPKSISTQLMACQEQLDSLGLGHGNLSDICSRAANLQLAAKQTKSGQSAFLLYEDSDINRTINEFKAILTDSGYKSESLGICCKGVETTTIRSIAESVE